MQPRRRALRQALFGAFACLLSLGACRGYEITPTSSETPTPTMDFFLPQQENLDVDLLFVIDNSSSMLGHQAVHEQLVGMASTLQRMQNLPNIHMGVVSTDLGAGPYTNILHCEEAGGDRGVLGRVGGLDLSQACIGPGQRYIVDVQPKGCAVDRSYADFCEGHGCTQEHCTAMQRGDEVLALVTDSNGCPRCRNFSGTMEDVFSCLTDLGVDGCPFVQPLEAMLKALDPAATSENDGFARETAYLGIILVSAWDDCSASNPEKLFDPDPSLDHIDSELGFLERFRCFEFGVACDVNDRTVYGPRNDCQPRDSEDPSGLLHPTSRYTSFLEAVKDFRLPPVVSAVAGPLDQITVDGYPWPHLQEICQSGTGIEATPAVRLHSFVSHFADSYELHDWAFTNICDLDFEGALKGISRALSRIPFDDCVMGTSFAGCARGPAGTDCSPCLPSCTVFDIENYRHPEQARLRVPWCGEVCTTGLCTKDQLEPCTYDSNGRCRCEPPLYVTRIEGEQGCAPLYYSDAVPDPKAHQSLYRSDILPYLEMDPDLKTVLPRKEPDCLGPDCSDYTAGRASACWYLEGDVCYGHPVIRFVRSEDPHPFTFAKGSCDGVPFNEPDCTDGKDNDEDCLTDHQDPDCQE